MHLIKKYLILTFPYTITNQDVQYTLIHTIMRFDKDASGRDNACWLLTNLHNVLQQIYTFKVRMVVKNLELALPLNKAGCLKGKVKTIYLSMYNI